MDILDRDYSVVLIIRRVDRETGAVVKVLTRSLAAFGPSAMSRIILLWSVRYVAGDQVSGVAS